MRARKKKALYVVFLLITVLMFLHSWKTYVAPSHQPANYATKHHKTNGPHEQHHVTIYPLHMQQVV